MLNKFTAPLYQRLYLAFAIVSHAFGDIDETVRVKIPQGILEGRIKYTTTSLAFTKDRIKYYSFEGIPYAQPPKGDLRFKDPIPFGNWSGVYDATKKRSKCPQIIKALYRYEGHEDCLYINVYTRDLKRNPLRPVLFFIHGGKFKIGSAAFNNPMDYMLEMDAIIVSFNYRLHVLGFLSLNNENVPGNALNKDQVLALRWVNKNINYFGGDPNNVALYGPSSGSINGYQIQMSSMAQGLFHKSILVSGVYLCSWYTGYEPIAVVKDFGTFLGLKSNNTEDIYKYLMNLPEEELLLKAFDFEFKNDLQERKFSSTIEESFDGVESFLSMPPLAAYKSGNFSDVPTMVSFSSLEFARYLEDHLFENFTKNDYLLLPQIWKIPVGSKLFNDSVSKIKNFYFGSDNIQINNEEHFAIFTLLQSDVTFIFPINEVLRTHAEYAKSPLYVYKFSYRGDLNYETIERYKFQAAAHCDDRAYIINNIINATDLHARDNIVRQRLLTLYRNFLETSNPTSGNFTHLLPFKWLPYTTENKYYLSMNSEAVMSQNPDERRLKFWYDLEDFIIKEGHFDKNWKDTTCSFG